MLLTSKCNHDLKFIAALGKDNKFLIYYIINNITKTSIYITYMYSFLQITVHTIIENTNLYDLIDKSQHLIIICLNTIGNQQEILATRGVSYLLNLPDHITNYDFTYILCYNLSAWVKEEVFFFFFWQNINIENI